MKIAKADLTPVSPRIIPVAFAGMLICGNWAAAQTDLYGGAAQPTKPTAAAAPDKQPIPSLEQLLARTLAAHPEIVAARSKVQLAEAELKLTRFQVAREQIALWNNWSWATHVFEEADELYQRKIAPAAPAIEAQAKLAALESEIRQVLADSAEGSSGRIEPASRSAVRRVPRGPIAETIQQALAQPVTLDFVDEPIGGAVDFLKEELAMGGMFVDDACTNTMVTVTCGSAPFVALIQLLEDLYPELRFVVREYGIFVTTKGSPVDLESISAVDFWLETAAESEKVQPKR